MKISLNLNSVGHKNSLNGVRFKGGKYAEGDSGDAYRFQRTDSKMRFKAPATGWHNIRPSIGEGGAEDSFIKRINTASAPTTGPADSPNTVNPPGRRTRVSSICRGVNLTDVVRESKSPEDIYRAYDESIATIQSPDGDWSKGYENFEALTKNIKCKIDFTALGIDPDELSKTRLAEYAAIFAFFTTSLAGEPRHGIERPPYVRSVDEYLTLLADRDPEQAYEEFKDIKNRIPHYVIQGEKDKQLEYDGKFKLQMAEYERRNPKPGVIDRLKGKQMPDRPKKQYTPIFGKEAELLDAIHAKEERERLAEEERRRQQEREEYWARLDAMN